MRRLTLSVLLTGILVSSIRAEEAEQKIFSGPQAGEALAPLSVKGVYGEDAGKIWDLNKAAGEGPRLLVFLHKRTRPAFGLARVLMTYVSKRKDDKLTGGIIWLSADPTETENWLSVVEKYFPQTKRMPVVYSPDGIEGPGAYGLNRNVTMTILVADKSRVTANFALVQPSLEADFPKIMKAVVAAAGGELPKLADLQPQAMRNRQRAPRQNANDEKLTGLLRQFIQKDASNEEVKKIAGQIEDYIKDKPAAQAQLGSIISRIEAANKLSNYGTAKARESLREWGKTYGPKDTPRPAADAPKQRPGQSRD